MRNWGKWQASEDRGYEGMGPDNVLGGKSTPLLACTHTQTDGADGQVENMISCSMGGINYLVLVKIIT